jgi:hypothetical protein
MKFLAKDFNSKLKSLIFFLEQRNLLAHRFYSATKNQRGIIEISDPDIFLQNFIEKAQTLTNAVLGLMSYLLESTSTTTNGENVFEVEAKDLENRNTYDLFSQLKIIQKSK